MCAACNPMCEACNPMYLNVLAHVAHAEDKGLCGRAVPLEQVDHARRHYTFVDVLRGRGGARRGGACVGV
jgi:hypothetical protein